MLSRELEWYGLRTLQEVDLGLQIISGALHDYYSAPEDGLDKSFSNFTAEPRWKKRKHGLAC
jgi:hypothetical protein